MSANSLSHFANEVFNKNPTRQKNENSTFLLPGHTHQSTSSKQHSVISFHFVVVSFITLKSFASCQKPRVGWPRREHTLLRLGWRPLKNARAPQLKGTGQTSSAFWNGALNDSRRKCRLHAKEPTTSRVLVLCRTIEMTRQQERQGSPTSVSNKSFVLIPQGAKSNRRFTWL